MSEYWDYVRQRAAELGSDGCTGVPDLYLDCCFEHDIAYFTGGDVFSTSVTRAQADARFRRCIQSKSVFGILSPVSWWRWAGVRLLGKRHWKDTTSLDPKQEPLPVASDNVNRPEGNQGPL